MNSDNWTALTRIAWKDMRRMGGLWIAFVGFWVMFLVISGVSTASSGKQLAPTLDLAFLAILATAMVYGLSWAGITFAAEHDDKTYGHLRSLPVTAHQVFYGKLGFGVGSMLLLILALSLLCALHVWVMDEIGAISVWNDTVAFNDVVMWMGWLALLIPLAIAVGLFWSLRLTNPLQALGLATLSLIVFAIGLLVFLDAGASRADLDTFMQSAPYWYSLGWLALASAAIFIADSRLALRWLPNELRRESRRTPVAKTGTRLGRLFWLHRHQNFWWAILLSGIFLLLSFVVWAAGPSEIGEAWYLFVPVTCGWLGITAFRSEHQEKRYRWLAQLHVRPWEYWLSRLLVPSIAALIAAGTFLAAHKTATPSWDQAHIVAKALVFSSLTAFCIGQFWSIAVSSIVISVALTLVTTMVASAWIALCVKFVPLWLSPAPLLLFPLLASYLRVSRWFRDTGSWKQWVVPSLPLALLVLGLPIATACYRVYEVPSVTLPPEMLAEPPQPTKEELAGAAQLTALFSTVPETLTPNTFEAWVNDNPKVAHELVQIAQRPFVLPYEFDGFLEPMNGGTSSFVPLFAKNVLTMVGGRETVAGNVEQAWQYYRTALEVAWKCEGPRASASGVTFGHDLETRTYLELIPWAMCEGTSSEQIKLAAAYIDERRQSLTPCTDIVRNERRVYMDAMNGLLARAESFGDTSTPYLFRFLPWEIARAKRLVDYVLVNEFRQAQRYEGSIAPSIAKYNSISLTRVDELLRTTLLPTIYPDTLVLLDRNAEQDRRGTIYQLIAIAYHKQHGSYPTDMSTLTVGGRPLPDDMYNEGKMIVMGLDPGDAIGPRVVSPMAGQEQTFSDETRPNKHFLLPVFENWIRKEFEARVDHSSYRSRDSAADDASSSPSTQAKLTAYDLLRFLPDETVAQAAQLAVISVFEKGTAKERADLAAAYDLLEFLPEETVSQAAQLAVRRVFEKGTAKERGDLLERLVDTPGAALLSVPDLATQLESPDVRLATLTSRFLASAMQVDAAEVRERVPNSPMMYSFDAPTDTWGVPIPNHANGHFYELVPVGTDWGLAPSLAARRTYRGVSGQVAVVASLADSQFVQAMLAAQGESEINVVLRQEVGGPLVTWRWTDSHGNDRVPMARGVGGIGMGYGMGAALAEQECNEPTWEAIPEPDEGSFFSVLVEYDPQGE